jgi:alpha-tubulin suppressor-like RCC1 family protein
MQVGADNSWARVRTSWGSDGPTCAIGGGSGLHCYGPSNSFGQLGLGNVDPTEELTRVGTSSTWEEVAPGSRHSCGIDGGRLFCWGNNDYGQLGLGASVVGENQLSPVQVGSDEGWSHVAVSESMVSCGIREGELYCWGRDDEARPGLDSTGDASTPLRVGSRSNWRQVDLNAAHGCGVLDDGALYCWGDNTRDLLGLDTDGEPAHIPEPTLVNPGSSWAQVSVGLAHSCGVQDDDSVWCWGSNESGELGVGPSWSTAPVPVALD